MDKQNLEETNLENLKENNARVFEGLHLSNIAVVPGVNVCCELDNPEEKTRLQKVFEGDGLVVLVTSKTFKASPQKEDIFEFACLSKIEKIEQGRNGVIKVNIQGKERVKILSVLEVGAIKVQIEKLTEVNALTENAKKLAGEVKNKCFSLNKYGHFMPIEIEQAVLYSPLSPGQLADSLVHVLIKDISMQQKMLSELDVEKRLKQIILLIDNVFDTLKWKKEIDDKVNDNLSKSQKEMFLREQMKVINDELNGEENEIEDLKTKVKNLKLPKEHEEKVLKEINKMAKLPFGSPEVGYIRNFVETVLELPWTEKTEDNLDLNLAKKVLDEDHYALEKVKERILESLAVMKLTKKVSAQIICLVGPPGVGKTSIARSIARAMGRKFVQVSLGGVSDESVIRGHRRTYVGAMCGRILSAMKQAKTINPVFLLDEIDKLTRDIRGDPSSALLEVLDPEQNKQFKDNFLELSYDLSEVLFIITANTLETIPKPLLDRMEIIELRSYTEIEKIHIAKEHLIEKQEVLCGLKPKTIPFNDHILSKIIREYTYEAGVRNLERAIATICRKYASFEAGQKRIDLTENNLPEFLGNDFVHELEIYEGGNVGEVVGLAVTSVGGSTLLVEANVVPGDKNVVLTGRLGDTMKESAQTAYSLVKSMAKDLGIDPERFSKEGLHIHIPHVPGGVEGPSAGIATTTAIVSAFLNKPVKKHLAMTGEVSLRGRVLPIGGVRDKLIAASRVGAKTIILPKDNEKDLNDLPDEIRNSLDIHLVCNISEVLNLALEKWYGHKKFRIYKKLFNIKGLRWI